MESKRFIAIFALLLLIIFGIVVYSLIVTLSKNNSENGNVTIDELNELLLQSDNFKSSRVNDIEETNIEEYIDIKKDQIKTIYGKKAILNTDSSMYILIEPNNADIQELYDKLVKFGKEYEDEWNNYLESEYDIVKERKIGIINNFAYFIVSEDEYDIVNKIQNKR